MSPQRQRPGDEHVVLVGLMATGKSTVGGRVADALGRPFVDSDAQVEAETGRTVRDIWLTDGEDTFRRLEADALDRALASERPSVIAAAGGVVLAAENRRRLSETDSVVVWLRARPATLLSRIQSAESGHRPLLDDDPAGKLEAMVTDRTPLYDQVADVVVDVDQLTPEAVAQAVLDGVHNAQVRS